MTHVMRRFDEHQGRPRAFKRYCRKTGMDHPTLQAQCLGEAEAYKKNPRPNPYPPGRRHDAWDDGFKYADPLGDWHGRNL